MGAQRGRAARAGPDRCRPSCRSGRRRAATPSQPGQRGDAGATCSALVALAAGIARMNVGERVAGDRRGEPGAEGHVLEQAGEHADPGLLGRGEQPGGGQRPDEDPGRRRLAGAATSATAPKIARTTTTPTQPALAYSDAERRPVARRPGQRGDGDAGPVRRPAQRRVPPPSPAAVVDERRAARPDSARPPAERVPVEAGDDDQHHGVEERRGVLRRVGDHQDRARRARSGRPWR